MLSVENPTKVVFKFVVCALWVLVLSLATSIETYSFPKPFRTDSTRIDSLSDELRNYVPTLHPQLIKERLACMEGQIKMTYNPQLLKLLEFYTVRQRDYTQRMLEKSSFYFPIFEEALRRHNMPDELKYLSIVESALTPKAASWAAAVGLWQFIPATGKEYGLQQDWYIDERMDIYKSTDAACRYLKFLYKYHGDWQLALAAYNCGPGRVDWAVKRAGGKGADFWTIYNYLPYETRGYVPAFIAVCYAMQYSKDHFIYAKNPYTHIPADTLQVSQFLNIEEFAKQLQVPVEQMEMLNPHLKKKAVPAYKKNYPVWFPAEKRAYLDSNRTAILSASRFAGQRQLYYTPGNDVSAATSTTEGKTKVTHSVKYGESLALIALKYGVTATNLRVWNRMPSDVIYPNQQLALWVKTPANTTQKSLTPIAAQVNIPQKSQPIAQNTAVKPQVATKTPPQITKTKTTGKLKYHTVKSGDTLWDIAAKYKLNSADQIKKWNRLTDKSMLMPGQQLVVGVN
jgi:membrane-bound lytic murein transglycosylase D